jgi:hypothetical protein
VAVAVAERRVDEVDAELERAAQGTQRLGVVGADPARAADASRAVAERRDLEACRAERAMCEWARQDHAR